MVSATFDLGTEFALPSIQPIAADALFPWLHPAHPQLEAEYREGDDFEDLVDPPEVAAPWVSVH